MLVLIASTVDAAQTEIRFHGDYSASQRSAQRAWMYDAAKGVEILLGDTDYEQIVHLHRRASAEPVPFARTYKGFGREAHFYIDPRFKASEFRDDWTASHELIHLIFPYLGNDSRWFAEGIATYLQYQAMYAAGELSWRETVRRMERRWQATRRSTHGAHLSIIELNNELRRYRNYPRLYWGGAAYFLLADQALHAQAEMRLNEVIAKYIACCTRRFGDDAQSMIKRFDELSNSTVFTDTYDAAMMQQLYPEVSDAVKWLQANPPSPQGSN